MSDIFPFIPLQGGSPLTYLVVAGLVGTAFGFFLERSGFGSSKKLTAVFTLRDWDVYRVMFTALVTAMVGAQLLSAFGWMELRLLEVGTTYLWPMFIGGLVFGVGFYIGGFCPGTAVVAAVRGRLDAVVFLVGIVLGIYGFALFFDGAGQASWFQSFYAPAGATVQSFNGHPLAWLLAIAIGIGVMVSFRYLYIFEQRYRMLTPAQLKAKEPRPQAVRPRAGRSTRAVIGVAAALAVVLGVFAVGSEESELLAIGSVRPTPVAADRDSVPAVDALSLVGWIVSDAHRVAEETPPNSYVLDLRDETERTAVPIRGTVVVPPAEDRLGAVMDVLDDLLTPADRNKPLVIIDRDNALSAQQLVADLRVQGINALLLEGGATAWQTHILAVDAAWPEWVVGGATESTTSLAAPSMADYHDDVRAWMTGTTADVPYYLSIPGTEQLPSEAATVVATGSGGGGCG
jgi:uncharacterized membrane protein YedE/YeeE/rhodanese-related sulfurtransferase